MSKKMIAAVFGLIALLGVMSNSNEAKAQEASGACATFCGASSPMKAAQISIAAAWGGFMVYLVNAHQKYTNGELRASADDATFGGEERQVASYATPAYSAVSVAYNPQRDAIMAQWDALGGDAVQYARFMKPVDGDVKVAIASPAR